MALASRPVGLRAATGHVERIFPAPLPARSGRVIARAAHQQQQEAECSPSVAPELSSRRALLRGVAALAAGTALAARTPAARAADATAAVATESTGYLLASGARGLLAEEEARLVALRKELEEEVRRELAAERDSEVCGREHGATSIASRRSHANAHAAAGTAAALRPSAPGQDPARLPLAGNHAPTARGRVPATGPLTPLLAPKPPERPHLAVRYTLWR
jgi:hypothetical protein